MSQTKFSDEIHQAANYYRGTAAPAVQQQGKTALTNAETTLQGSSSNMMRAANTIVADWNQVIQQVCQNIDDMATDLDTIANNMSQSDEDNSNAINNLLGGFSSDFSSFLSGK
ncbi:MAG TPA: hypothetical protein VF444_14880 [Pseudonocardiaceae bacterium]